MTIEAWTFVEGETKGDGFLRSLRKTTVDPERVRAQLEELRSLLPADEPLADGTIRRWRMEEINLTAEFTTEGGIRLVGSAAVSISAAISIKFLRAT